MLLSATELAGRLGVSKGRVSQYVSEGKLDGCYTGDGRARRFDLGKVAVALGRRLDAGQSMGNGSATRAAIEAIRQDEEESEKPASVSRRMDGPLPAHDDDRYQMARTLKAEEEARSMRRRNAEAEGLYVLASEAHLVTARMVGQEVAEFETVLRDGARKVADELGVDFKTVRAILTGLWREHRGRRAGQLAQVGREAVLTSEERAADI